MSLKKATIASVLALAVGVSAVGAASAAVSLSTPAYTVNGTESGISTFYQSGRTLVAIRDLSKKLGASLAVSGKTITVKLNGHAVELTVNSAAYKVDGVAKTLNVPVKSVSGSTYVELKVLVEALGATFTKDASGVIWIDANLLADVDHAQWANATSLIASKETDSGRIDYLINAKTGKYTELLNQADASDLVVSPAGTKAAYTNAAGEIFVIDLQTKASAKVSGNTEIKPELVWAADSSAIYFLQGDKGTIISKLTLAGGEVTAVLADAVDYKGSLSVSADGKIFTYTVTKPGAVTADASKPVELDDVTIDTTGTEPQVFLYDSSSADNKPVKLTTSTDDKVFVKASANGHNVFYASIPADAATATLVKASGTGVVSTVFDREDVAQAVLAGDVAYLLTAGAAASHVYTVDLASGAAKLLYTVPSSVSELIVGAGSPIAIVKNGNLYVYANGLWKPLSR